MARNSEVEMPVWVSSYPDEVRDDDQFICPSWVPHDLVLKSCLSAEGHILRRRSRQQFLEAWVNEAGSVPARRDRFRRLDQVSNMQAERVRLDGPACEAVREAYVYNIAILARVGDGPGQTEWTGANSTSDWMPAQELLLLIDQLEAQRPMLEEEARNGG